MTPFAVDEPKPMHRYRNDFRWRVMPSEKATEDGYFTRSFGNKVKALAYQKLIKTLYPDEVCCLCDTGKYYDAEGRIYHSREGR